MAKVHYAWIDWMKVIGMYFIIAGHFFPVGYEYIYVFSVPLFFIISGFLSKVEDNNKIFWQKLFHNLVLPCIVLCLILHFIEIIIQLRANAFHANFIPAHLLNCILGFQGEQFEAGGLGIMWFIYTLILCKIINQYASHSCILQSTIVAACLTCAILYHIKDMHMYNAAINVSLAYPYFLVGGGYKQHYKSNATRLFVHYFIILVSLLIVILVGYYNGAPWMYDNSYGKYIIPFYIGGMAGSLFIYKISCYLRGGRLISSFVGTISKGTIVVLGFHKLFIKLFERVPLFEERSIWCYFLALIILFLFYPIIILIEKFFPVVLGNRARKK